MKKLLTFAPIVLGLAFISSGCADKVAPTTTESGSEAGDMASGDELVDMESEAELSDIVDTAVAAGGFETLVAAVKAAELVDTLKGEGPFTVFAPTEQAFAALPEGTLDDLLKPENKDKLVAILTYHVVPGKVMAADVVDLNSATTVQGGDIAIAVEGETVTINGANVIAADVECSNGVIHVIDAVILPPSE